MTGKFWVEKVASRRLREQQRQGLQEANSQLRSGVGRVPWGAGVMGEGWGALEG